VQVEFTEGNVSVVAQGLNPGDVVVVDGADKIQPGEQVIPHQASSNRTSSTTSSSPTGTTP